MRVSSRRRLIENTGSLFILQAANYLLPLIILPYLVRVLGPEKFGLLAFAQAFMQFLVVFTDYGFDYTATRQIATQREDSEKVSEIFSTVMLIKLCFMLVSFLLMAGIIFAVPKLRVDWALYFVAFLMVVGTALFPIWIFQGMERMKYITVINVGAKTLAAVTIFVFVHSEADYILAAGIQAGGFVVAGVSGVWIAWRRFEVELTWPRTWSTLWTAIKEGGQVFTSVVAGTVIGQGGVLITGLIAGPTSAGYLSIAQKVADAASNLVKPVAQAFYPYLSRLFESDATQYRIIKHRILLLGVSLGTVMGILQYTFCEIIAKLVSGITPQELIMLIKIFSVAMALTMMNVLVHPIILSMKKYSEMQKMYAMIATVYLLVSIPATFLAGSIGMALSIVFVCLILLVTGMLIIKDKAAPKVEGEHR